MNDGTTHLSRRRFLEGAAVLGLALLPAGLLRVASGSPESDATSLAVERLAGLFPDPAEVAPLGRRYLEVRGETLLPEELLRELLPPEMGTMDASDLTDEELRAAVGRWAASDLADGRIEEVDGWLLSATGVRLAALVMLVAA